MTRAEEVVERMRELGMLGKDARRAASVIGFLALCKKRILQYGMTYWVEEAEATEYAIWLRFHPKFQCCYCDARPELLDRRIDHFLPLSRGGKHHFGNLMPACKRCQL